MNPQAIAAFLLACMDKNSVQASDEGLTMAQAARSMLKALKSGEFVIVTAAAPSSNPVPPGAEP